MRIGIAVQDVQSTMGQGRVNYELIRGLARHGCDVVVIAITLAPSLQEAANVTWHRVSIPRGVRKHLIRNQLFAAGARRAILSDRKGFDILQLNGATTSLPADVNVSHFVHAHWLRSPFHRARTCRGASALYHRLYTAWNAAGEKRAFRSARRVVAVSGLLRDSLVEEIGIDPKRLSVICPGVDSREFRPPEPGERERVRAALGLRSDHFLLAFTGDIKTNRKNLDLALKALAGLPARSHLVIAGSIEGSAYPEKAQMLGVGERVHFLGHRSDVSSLLRASDAFVFPSHYDPFALVILEAMASGVPVVTVPSVGASMAIHSGENGFVLQHSTDLDGMLRALYRLESDPHLAARIGHAARATAEQLSWDAMARSYQALYAEIVAEKAAPGSSSRAFPVAVATAPDRAGGPASRQVARVPFPAPGKGKRQSARVSASPGLSLGAGSREPGAGAQRP